VLLSKWVTQRCCGGMLGGVGLVIAGVVGTALVLYRDRKASAVEKPGSAQAYAG
jgi:hypothetical protein